jgi:predicted DsbA family dithiol-disulfide isomerase
VAVVHVTYFTDPADPWSWAAEPALRRLQAEFGDDVRITYVMGGRAREITDPLHELLQALEASSASGMPVDARIWNGRPPRSTYPASLAVKAAAEQGRDGDYLRVLREGFMVDRRPQDTAEALEDAARRVGGLDQARFAIDLRSNAITEAFGADLERARGVELPTFAVGDERMSGRIDAAALARAVADAGARPGPLPDVETALRRFGRMAVPEVAAVCGIAPQRAAGELWRLAMEFRARPERVLAGELWGPPA